MRETENIDDPTWKDIHDRDERIQALQAALDSLTNELRNQREHANLHYSSAEFLGIDGYGPFRLKRICKDRWEIHMLREKVILYNKKGHRVRADVDNSYPNYDGDW